MSLGERPRGSARPTPNEHYNSLPRTSIEGALGYDDQTGKWPRLRRTSDSDDCEHCRQAPSETEPAVSAEPQKGVRLRREEVELEHYRNSLGVEDQTVRMYDRSLLSTTKTIMQMTVDDESQRDESGHEDLCFVYLHGSARLWTKGQ